MENNEMSESNYMNTKDLKVTLTCKEHELLTDVLDAAVDSLYVLFPGGCRELPEDSKIYIRFKELEDLQNKCANSYAHRFD